MTRRGRVLISAFIGSDNLGDEAIFLSLAGQLTKRIPGSEVTALSVNPEKTRGILRAYGGSQLESIDIRHRARFWIEVVRHEICIFGGGGIIQDQSSILNLLYFVSQIVLARVLRKDIALAFVGIGPLRSRIGRGLAGAALRGVALCIVRDEESAQCLQDLGVDRSGILCGADLALHLNCEHGPGSRAAVEDSYIVVCLRHWYVQSKSFTRASRKSGRVVSGTRLDALLLGIAAQLSAILEQYPTLRIVAVPFYGQRDEKVHDELLNKLAVHHRQRVTLAGAMLEPCEFLRVAAAARCIIGMRLHALILASMTGAPLVALSYSGKVASFMRQLGLDRFIVDIECEPNVGVLSSRVDEALESGVALRKTIRTRVEALRKQNESVLDALGEFVRRKSRSTR